MLLVNRLSDDNAKKTKGSLSKPITVERSKLEFGGGSAMMMDNVDFQII